MELRSPEDLWVVIPTYWGPRAESSFDHPTPIDGESTLPRLLESLAHQVDAPPFSVLVLLAAVAPRWLKPATERLERLLAPFSSHYQLFLAVQRTLEILHACLQDHHLETTGIDLASYPGVRNVQLLIPSALGARLIVGVDDDEVLPPSHLARAIQTTRQLQQGREVFGLAGPYLDHHGSAFLPEASAPQDLFAAKSAYMNQALRSLLNDSDPYPVSPMALGGNMVFPRALFTRIGFDPAITRGEDIDYLLNARLQGYAFHFDKALAIQHLPPRHYEAPAYAKLRQDVYRFVYQKEKLRISGTSANIFDPYPGRLLRADLLQNARRALRAEEDPSLTAQWGSPEEILREAQAYASERAPAYAAFAHRWPQIHTALHGPAIRAALRTPLSHQ